MATPRALLGNTCSDAQGSRHAARPRATSDRRDRTRRSGRGRAGDPRTATTRSARERQEAAGGADECEPSVLPGRPLADTRQPLDVPADRAGIRLMLLRHEVRLGGLLDRQVDPLGDGVDHRLARRTKLLGRGRRSRVRNRTTPKPVVLPAFWRERLLRRLQVAPQVHRAVEHAEYLYVARRRDQVGDPVVPVQEDPHRRVV